MIKEYLKSRNIPIKSLSIDTGIPYSTINDLVNGKTSVERIRFGYAIRIADVLNISLDDFARLFTREESNNPDNTGDIIVKNKSYYLKCKFNTSPVYLCKVNQLNQKYITEIASWKYEALSRKEAFDQWERKTSI